ncbi:MAG: hypothetical protein IT168_04115 [Bryobacterales bacterium]|nr:hypothetical protein [Bryobacterales bacterium]
MHDRSGKVVGRYRLWFPGASYVKIWDAASDGKDGVVVVGIALDGSGQLVGYLAIISLSVNSARIIATSPFEGQNVVYGADGSIWILGFETSDSQRKITTSTPHALLHHLTSSGQLISKHLPWPEVGCGFHPLVGEAAMMTAIGDGVGIYMPACRSWFELTSSGDLANRLPVQLPNSYNSKNATFWNVFVTKDRRVFAYVNHPGHVASNGTAVANGVFSLRKDTGLWDPIDDRAALTAGEINWLAGTDENRLVCAVGANELIWVDTLP